MPRLYQLPTKIAWGDLFMTEDGGVFSIDANGYPCLTYGSPPKVNKDSKWNGNDDGAADSCVALACKHLGLEPPTESLTHSQLDEYMLKSNYERIFPSGTVANFIRDHKVGEYFVCAYNSDAGSGHAFAVIDGEARNITFNTLRFGIRAAWCIR